MLHEETCAYSVFLFFSKLEILILILFDKAIAPSYIIIIELKNLIFELGRLQIYEAITSFT